MGPRRPGHPEGPTGSELHRVLAAKDVTLATALAREFGVEVPMGSLSEHLLTAYRDGGFAAEDLLATVKGVEEQAGIVVRGRGPDL